MSRFKVGDKVRVKSDLRNSRCAYRNGSVHEVYEIDRWSWRTLKVGHDHNIGCKHDPGGRWHRLAVGEVELVEPAPEPEIEDGPAVAECVCGSPLYKVFDGSKWIWVHVYDWQLDVLLDVPCTAGREPKISTIKQ